MEEIYKEKIINFLRDFKKEEYNFTHLIYETYRNMDGCNCIYKGNCQMKTIAIMHVDNFKACDYIVSYCDHHNKLTHKFNTYEEALMFLYAEFPIQKVACIDTY